ncbi:hypothetical protein H6P81_003241 [Aristolochia fimbriata]|uniref:DUF309 domain-containing protein n=1 Tax=Aristolochia fimbriata TaxID=158543 RepID=A0AAV7FGF7_ARIFI|nr:hypothetical protein H6P81_003241 [Aristolochia fimbriata]
MTTTRKQRKGKTRKQKWRGCREVLPPRKMAFASPVSTFPVPLPVRNPNAVRNPSTSRWIRFTNFSSSFASRSSYFCISYRYSYDDFFEEPGEEGGGRFDEAVRLFNSRDFYKCHDSLEAIWVRSEEPKRTLIHGILQCAVGFHHLFNQNHRGAMMELGEGLCKLRKLNFSKGPFHQFEREISAVLDFIYQTQLELAACGDDLCVAMDGSERSYQLLGSFAAGRRLYEVEKDGNDTAYIVFFPENLHYLDRAVRVKLPILSATEEHLETCGYS